MQVAIITSMWDMSYAANCMASVLCIVSPVHHVCVFVCVCVGFCMCDVCVEYASLYLFLPFSSLLTLPPKYSAIQTQL